MDSCCCCPMAFGQRLLELAEQRPGHGYGGGRRRLEDDLLQLQAEHFDEGRIDEQTAPHMHEGVGDAPLRRNPGNAGLEHGYVHELTLHASVGKDEIGVVMAGLQVENLRQVDNAQLVARLDMNLHHKRNCVS